MVKMKTEELLEIPSAGEYLIKLTNPTKVSGFYDLDKFN